MLNIIDGRLSALDAYLKNKRLRWALIRTGRLNGCGRLIKIYEIIGTVAKVEISSHFEMKLRGSVPVIIYFRKPQVK